MSSFNLNDVVKLSEYAKDKKKEIFVYGELPYEVTFRSDSEGFSVLFENSVRFYDFEGTETVKHDFAYSQIQSIMMTKNYSAVVLNEKTLGSSSRILIFDVMGKLICENIVSAEIMDIKFSEDYDFLYFLTRTGLYKIDIDRRTFEFVTNKYDETTDRIVYANTKNIFLSGFVKVNITDTDNADNTEINEINESNTDITNPNPTGANNPGDINSIDIS